MLIDRSNQKLPDEDEAAFGVLEYQIGKLLDQAVVEDVPSLVALIDKVADEDPGDVPVGHKFMTEDESLYRLPSGTYVMVGWGFHVVSPEEGAAQIAELMEEEELGA